FILDGQERSLSSDNDPTFTLGGKYIGEKQDTNNGVPFFLIDSTTGVMSGIEERVSHADGTLGTLDAAAQKCATDGPVSCSVTMADGKTYQAKGGVMIIFDNTADGMMTVREGKAAYSVHPAEGKWI
ncbi:unnamed protein product, partial [marine sediment metagenome]